jgi:hypothetical protein
MAKSLTPMLELHLIHREPGKEDVPIDIAIGQVYSPPDILTDAKADDTGGWCAVRVRVSSENAQGSELPGANALEALEHALLHVKSFLRMHLSSGGLYDRDGNPFDPDAKSSVFQARLDHEDAAQRATKKKRR